MSTILLSIKPEYSHKILAGEKKYEYRKRVAHDKVDTIIIYSSAPDMKVVGKVKVLEIISGSPTYIWESTKAYAGITREKFREYFRGIGKAYAYKLGNPEIFEPAQTLSAYNIQVAPQSFVYIDKDKRTC